MIEFIVGLIIGLFIGAILGVLIASLNVARRNADDAAERMHRGE